MFFNLRWTVLALAGLVSSTLALDIRGRIQWNDHCSDIIELGYAKAILDNGKRYSGGITQDGHFVIPSVAPGTYILTVVSHDHQFDRLRIDVSQGADTDVTLPEIRPYIPGTPLSPPSSVLLSYPVTMIPRHKNDYTKAAPSFDALGMLKSPMVLMMIAAAVMAFAMPTLMKSMDPDSLADFNERHAKINGIQQAFAGGDIKSGFSKLMDVSDEQPASSSAVSTPARAKATKKRK